MDTKDILELAEEVGADSSTSVKDLLDLQGEIPYLIYQINIGKYRLAITFGEEDESVLRKYRGNIYILNIKDDEPHVAFNWKSKWARNLIEKQLTHFMPIIQKFMVDALTDNLEIVEESQ